ncbi:MAG: hypothetical protein Q8S18_04195 [Bacteroidales bacterium]|nr:hypothetical protein [Bacteroidales bacterium]
MNKYLQITVLKFLSLVIVFMIAGCGKEEQNPDIPSVYINITIDPSSTFYQELNTVGGWIYLTSEPPSRGLIVYRLAIDEFIAYDRYPPNNAGKCCTAQGVCTRLLVDDYFPFVQDTCTNTSYLILDGSKFEGEGRYPLIRYNTVYNGQMLRIFN